MATCQLAHGLHLFSSYSFQCVAAALVVVYSTDSSSRSIAIEAGRLLSASRSCHAVGLGASVPRHGLWRGRTWTQIEPRLRVGASILFILEILNAFAIIKKNLESDKRIGRRVTNGWDHLRSTMGNPST